MSENLNKVAVTGGSGKAGRWVVKELLDHGYEVLNLDMAGGGKDMACRTVRVDLTDLGQVHNALSAFNGKERTVPGAVVHLAAIPSPFSRTNDVVFRNNVMSTYNILEACANLGIGKTVIASSQSAYGWSFAHTPPPPLYLPVDEEHPLRPEDSYGLSKQVGEQLAVAFHRRTGMQAVSLRCSYVLNPEDYERVLENYDNPDKRRHALWSYIDARDLASACRLALEKDGLGAEVFNITADDTCSGKSTGELIETYFPEVRTSINLQQGRSSLISNEKSKQLLGWRQQYFLQENAEY